jgi:hypothetical protein
VEIKEAFIDFIPFDVKTAEMITAEKPRNWVELFFILKTARVSRMTIKQRWQVFILVFKSEFLI